MIHIVSCTRGKRRVGVLDVVAVEGQGAQIPRLAGRVEGLGGHGDARGSAAVLPLGRRAGLHAHHLSGKIAIALRAALDARPKTIPAHRLIVVAVFRHVAHAGGGKALLVGRKLDGFLLRVRRVRRHAHLHVRHNLRGGRVDAQHRYLVAAEHDDGKGRLVRFVRICGNEAEFSVRDAQQGERACGRSEKESATRDRGKVGRCHGRPLCRIGRARHACSAVPLAHEYTRAKSKALPHIRRIGRRERG